MGIIVLTVTVNFVFYNIKYKEKLLINFIIWWIRNYALVSIVDTWDGIEGVKVSPTFTLRVIGFLRLSNLFVTPLSNFSCFGAMTIWSHLLVPQRYLSTRVMQSYCIWSKYLLMTVMCKFCIYLGVSWESDTSFSMYFED